MGRLFEPLYRLPIMLASPIELWHIINYLFLQRLSPHKELRIA